MKKRLATMLAGASIAALALTGCGGGSPSGAASTEAPKSGEAGGLTKVVVGILPIAPSVAMQYGVDKKIFEKHGLDIELTTASAGAAMLPAVSTGDLNFAVGNPLSVITAVDKGLDMKIVTGYSNSKATGDDINGVVVRADSGINTFADLAGKTTSVNALKTQGDLTIMESAAIDGGDPKALKFSEMPFPDMEAQLDRKNMDAIWVPEPFLSKALAVPENKLLGYPNQKAIPGLPTMVSFTSGKFAQESPDVVAKFQAAMAETLDAAESDQAGAKALLPTFMKMDAKVAENLKMETWDAVVPSEQLDKLGALAAKFEFISKTPDIAALTIKK
ncbi:ABC transporter substrate-binding protein [Paeniglutamicibacter cryotolerans]|uniref:NitT/TauT family transport system substrate-binding protein n=1 Tax=Paeniglutamicibacter cryotolerans TaxID=670079 RepID=A0A839QE31_9MICC|nr:ABC transporter substrate-binding protein [Paeniglutamicibacter cryotolerans]MBB2994498.1 NitT/TauT family transport system substrate-binding protein [Paeniglutamicibacter cryotolerans]